MIVTYALGIAAAATLLLALLLGARKRWLRLRVGSVAVWNRAHPWVGALCLPLALLHARFRTGGPITTALLVLLVGAVATGLFGVLVQRMLPRVISTLVPNELPLEEIDRAIARLRKEAYELIWAACGAAPEVPEERDAIAKLLGAPRPPKAAVALDRGSAAGQDELARFYGEALVPWLRAPFEGSASLAADDRRARLAFETLRGSVSPKLEGPLARLSAIADEVRQAVLQARLQRWLESWLMLHIPLSVASAVLLAIHVAAALYYR